MHSLLFFGVSSKNYSARILFIAIASLAFSLRFLSILLSTMISGAMKLSNVEAAGMSLSSVSGIISGTLGGNPESYSFCANSRSGIVNVPNTHGPRKVEVKTGSGIISLAFAD